MTNKDKAEDPVEGIRLGLIQAKKGMGRSVDEVVDLSKKTWPRIKLSWTLKRLTFAGQSSILWGAPQNLRARQRN